MTDSNRASKKRMFFYLSKHKGPSGLWSHSSTGRASVLPIAESGLESRWFHYRDVAVNNTKDVQALTHKIYKEVCDEKARIYLYGNPY